MNQIDKQSLAMSLDMLKDEMDTLNEGLTKASDLAGDGRKTSVILSVTQFAGLLGAFNILLKASYDAKLFDPDELDAILLDMRKKVDAVGAKSLDELLAKMREWNKGEPN